MGKMDFHVMAFPGISLFLVLRKCIGNFHNTGSNAEEPYFNNGCDFDLIKEAAIYLPDGVRALLNQR